MESRKLDKVKLRRVLNISRFCRKNTTRAVTPVMLARALRALQEANLIGVYFSPMQVTQMVADMYPEVEQDLSLLQQEVKDKLICAANADIVGFKFDRGYYSLSEKGNCARIDTRSKLTFWLLYKNLVDQRNQSRKSKSKLFGAGRPSSDERATS